MNITDSEAVPRYEIQIGRTEIEAAFEDVGLYLVDGSLPDRGAAQLYGETGSYKSFIAHDLCLRVTTGMGEWFGHKIELDGPADAVYIAAEEARDFDKRGAAWANHHKLKDYGRIAHIPPHGDFDILNEDDINDMAKDIALAGLEPKLIVIDTQAMAMPGHDEDKAHTASMMIYRLNQLAQYFDCLVLIVHHTGYNTSRARGSSGQISNFAGSIRVTSNSVRVEKVKTAPSWETPRKFNMEPVDIGADRPGIVPVPDDRPANAPTLAELTATKVSKRDLPRLLDYIEQHAGERFGLSQLNEQYLGAAKGEVDERFWHSSRTDCSRQLETQPHVRSEKGANGHWEFWVDASHEESAA